MKNAENLLQYFVCSRDTTTRRRFPQLRVYGFVAVKQSRVTQRKLGGSALCSPLPLSRRHTRRGFFNEQPMGMDRHTRKHVTNFPTFQNMYGVLAAETIRHEPRPKVFQPNQDTERVGGSAFAQGLPSFSKVFECVVASIDNRDIAEAEQRCAACLPAG